MSIPLPNLPHWAFADKHDLVPSEVRTDIKRYGESYAAAVSAAARDCRTCRNTITQYGVTRCNSTVVCTNADRYKPLPPVRLWKTT